MGAYLEYLELQEELGLISNKDFKQQKMLHLDNLNKADKDSDDDWAKKKLANLKQDKSTFLTVEMITILKATKKSTNQIKGWVTFFGVLYILGIAGYLLSLS